LSGRKELTILFNAISAAELKKGIRALEMADVVELKASMVTALINRFAPKRTRKRTQDEMEVPLPEGMAADDD
jgi:hypothetical protein